MRDWKGLDRGRDGAEMPPVSERATSVRAFRVAVSGVMLILAAWLVPAAPAFASVEGSRSTSRADLRPLEAQRAERWWEGQVRAGSLAFADMPTDQLSEAAQVAWAAGVTKDQLRAALFTDVAREIFAGNAAGGQGQPSPYLEYFANNPAQLGPLGDFLSASRSYVVGPGGTQDELFARFTGLRESYLASLGLVEVNGRIVDPRNPYLTPYFASLFLGPPAPLPQPDIALNVGGK
ncbi:MAG: hypothetical protein ACXWXP_06110 [Actinomycetota bacterium]